MIKAEKSLLKDPEFAKHCSKILISVVDGVTKMPKDIREKVEESIEKSVNLKCPDSWKYFKQKRNSCETKDITTEDKAITTLAEFIDEKNEHNIKLGSKGGNYEPSDIKAYRTLASILIDKDCWVDGWKRNADTMILILSEKGTRLMQECVEIFGSESIETNPFVIDPIISSKTYIQVGGFYKTNMKIVLGRRNISIDTEKELQFIIDRLCLLGNTSRDQVVETTNILKSSRFNNF